MPVLRNTSAGTWAGLGLVAALCLFPFALALLTGQWVDEGLPKFCQVMANAALFVAGSTGPLHIAAALDVPTIGFFPAHRSATPLRWRPLNSEGRHLAFSPPEDSDHPEDMSQLDPKTMAAAIARWAPPFWRTES